MSGSRKHDISEWYFRMFQLWKKWHTTKTERTRVCEVLVYKWWHLRYNCEYVCMLVTRMYFQTTTLCSMYLLCLCHSKNNNKSVKRRRRLFNLAMLWIFIVSFYSCWLLYFPKRHKPSFPAETFAMGFNQHKPVLEYRGVPQRRWRWVKRKIGWSALLLLRLDFSVDVLHDNSFLLLSLLCRLSDLSSGGNLLLHRLDDTNSDGLPHVTHGKATWRTKANCEVQ